MGTDYLAGEDTGHGPLSSRAAPWSPPGQQQGGPVPSPPGGPVTLSQSVETQCLSLSKEVTRRKPGDHGGASLNVVSRGDSASTLSPEPAGDTAAARDVASKGHPGRGEQPLLIPGGVLSGRHAPRLTRPRGVRPAVAPVPGQTPPPAGRGGRSLEPRFVCFALNSKNPAAENSHKRVCFVDGSVGPMQLSDCLVPRKFPEARSCPVGCRGDEGFATPRAVSKAVK